MTKKSKIFRKNFLVGIDLEWSKTYFKTQISILKIFPVGNFFRDITVSSKNWWPKNRKFFEMILSSESIQNGPKRVLKRKYRFWKFFHIEIFFRRQSFFRKMGIMGRGGFVGGAGVWPPLENENRDEFLFLEPKFSQHRNALHRSECYLATKCSLSSESWLVKNALLAPKLASSKSLLLASKIS